MTTPTHITNEQEPENHAGIAQERDEPASSRKKTNTADVMRQHTSENTSRFHLS